jgi:hypothetical protein
MNSKSFLVITLLVAFFIVSCKNNNKDVEGNEVEITQEDIQKSYEQAQAIFYSLPSPIETALILENAGVEFNSEILNSITNVNDYETNKKKALNLGVYSADLSYASLFDQQQITINYMAASKKLADQLGILDAINETTIQKLEENISDKDEIMNIISETFMNSSTYLEENNRGEISALIILGGWIEGLYISVQLVENNIIQNQELVEIIISQQFSLEDMIGLLDYYEEYKEVRLLSAELKELKLIFEKMEGTKDSKNFSLLVQKVNDIRTGYIE